MDGLLHQDLSAEVFDGGHVVIELLDHLILRELHCYFDGVLLAQTVDHHATLAVRRHRNDEPRGAPSQHQK